MFLDIFKAIYVINLRRRSDRRAEMMQQLDRLGLGSDPRVRFFDAAEPTEAGCFPQPGAHGCYLSHLMIFEREAPRGRHILILEDDCDFTRAAAAYELPTEWDVFYGGYTAANPSDPENSNIIGSHCMAYSPRAVKLAASYLRNLLDPNFPPDPRAAADPNFNPSVRPPLDGALVWFRRAHPELKTVFSQIAVQRSSRSDIGASNWLDERMPALLGGVRKAKNWMRRRL